MLSTLWVLFLLLSLVCGIGTHRLDAVSTAISTGAEQAVTLAIAMAGLMAFWSGIMELLDACGLSKRLAQLLRPLLRPLFGRAVADDPTASSLICANLTANFVGLSNAATPLGLQAIDRLYTLSGRQGAPDCVLTLMLLNTTSIQLIPSTVAAVRAHCGAQNPFDLMPAVWGASLASVAVVLLAGRVLRGVFPDRDRPSSH